MRLGPVPYDGPKRQGMRAQGFSDAPTALSCRIPARAHGFAADCELVNEGVKGFLRGLISATLDFPFEVTFKTYMEFPFNYL